MNYFFKLDPEKILLFLTNDADVNSVIETLEPIFYNVNFSKFDNIQRGFIASIALGYIKVARLSADPFARFVSELRLLLLSPSTKLTYHVRHNPIPINLHNHYSAFLKNQYTRGTQ